MSAQTQAACLVVLAMGAFLTLLFVLSDQVQQRWEARQPVAADELCEECGANLDANEAHQVGCEVLAAQLQDYAEESWEREAER